MHWITAMLLFASMPSIASAQTNQQRYEAAQTAFDKGEWPTAAEGFSAVLPRLSGRPGAIVRSRYALTLAQLDRWDDAVTEAERAAKALAGPGADDERATAWLTLAHIRMDRLEPREAIDALAQARTAAAPSSPLSTRIIIAQIKAASVLEPARAIEVADAFRASSEYAAMKPIDQAQVDTLVARAKLNGGDPNGALPLARQALRRSGGTQTGRVNLIQAAIRSDAALVFLRTNNADEARLTMASAGGGYMPTSDWLSVDGNEPPVCDDIVKPDDVAVVQFDIDDQGDVVGATPVYASRAGGMGVVFARQVRQWHFPASSFSTLPVFWRTNVRFEMRCVTNPASDALSKPFLTTAQTWFKKNGVDWGRPGDGLFAITTIGPPSPLIAPAVDLMRRATSAGSAIKSEQIDAALAASGAPVDARAYFAWVAAQRSGRTLQAWATRAIASLTPVARQFDALPGGAHAAAWLWLEIAIDLETAGRFAEAKPLLDRVQATPDGALDTEDPIRLVATLHLSLVDRRLGDAAAAERRLATAGLDAEQCALFDVRPVPVAGGASSNDFPPEVLRWAMEGFAQSAFDIGPDGRVTNVRIVKAYPPFVFGPSTQHVIERSRFLPPTLNKVALGCSSHTKSVSFRVPHS